MKINGIIYFLLVLVVFSISMVIDFGIPLVLVLVGAKLAFWKFSWGLVLFFYVAFQNLLDIKHGMDFLGFEVGDE